MKAKRLNFTNLTFLLFALFLLFLSIYSYHRINKQAEVSELVDHNYILKITLKNAFIKLLRAESAQRGYILTNDKDLFQQYQNSILEIPPLLKQLESQFAGNEQQIKTFESTSQLFKKRIQSFDLVIDSFQYVSSARIDTFFYTGKVLSDSISSMIEMMNKRETLLLSQRLDQKHKEEKIASIFILIFSAFSIMILLFTFLRLRKESKLLKASIVNETKLEEIVSERTAEIVSVNKQLNLQNHELGKKNAELNAFTFIASHDLKEPLRKIEMYSGRLVKEDAQRLSENGRIFLTKITDSIHRMTNLIESIFSYAQVEQEMDTVEINLSESIEQATINLAELINEKDAFVDYKRLPTVKVVPEQMEQLFTNLIANAIKYAKKDIPPKINITAEEIPSQQGGKLWKIQVRDNGVGFDEIYKEKIFQIFQRAHSKNEYPGIGIGLAICKKIVENHKGSISASSLNGEGAIFTIILPENI